MLNPCRQFGCENWAPSARHPLCKGGNPAERIVFIRGRFRLLSRKSGSRHYSRALPLSTDWLEPNIPFV